MTNIWMWPQKAINSDTVCDSKETLANIEQFFSSLYSPFKVLYFSRARLALTAISAAEGLSRPQLTYVQPFSSHCVLSAISPLSTPTTTALEQSHQQVVFHQWGEKTKVNAAQFSNVLIEDAVDSIISTNDVHELFPNHAPYCLFSLPKVCQTAIGAIVVCKNDESYIKLSAAREQQHAPVPKQMHLINEPALQEAILASNPLLTPKVDDISLDFNQSEALVRQNLSEMSARFKTSTVSSYLVDPEAQRLPSNIAIPIEVLSEQALYDQVPFEVQEKQRTRFNYQSLACERVWLLPCHAQATWSE